VIGGQLWRRFDVRWCIAIGIVCLSLALGCDRSTAPRSAAVPPVPTTAPAPSVAVVTPPATDAIEAADNTPPSCFMMIGHQPVQFPPAMMRIQKKDGQVIAMLYSDDPKDALSDSYHGNGFYFQLKLDVPDTKFEEAAWIHQSESSERVDTPYGIFLDGHHRQLQPQDVRIQLLPSASGGIKVEMAGTFLSVDPQDALGATQMVDVSARVLADKR
jgi:hypothetical protein